MNIRTWTGTGLCAALLLLGACRRPANYENALPRDAALVVQADLASMVGKSSLGTRAGQTALDRLSSALKSGMEGSEELIDKMVQSPAESGLDLRAGVYVFAEPRLERKGLLAKVADASRLLRLLEALGRQRLCQEPRTSGGCTWTVLGSVLVACTDGACLVMTPAAGEEPADLLPTAARLLRQREGEGFAATEDYRLMRRQQADIVAFTSMELLPLPPELTMGLSAEFRQDEVKYISTVRFEPGKAVVDICRHTTDTLMNAFTARCLEATAPVQGSYLDRFPANTFCWMTARADGGRVFSLLTANPAFRQLAENPAVPVDIGALFRAVKGDMALALTDLSGEHFIAWADVADDRFLATFEELKPLLALTRGQVRLTGGDTPHYELRLAPGFLPDLPAPCRSLWFGVKDHRFYFTNDADLKEARVLGLSLRDNPWGPQVEGSYFFFALNANVVHRTFAETLKGQGAAAQLLAILAGLDYLTVRSFDGINARVELVMKDKSRNFLF